MRVQIPSPCCPQSRILDLHVTQFRHFHTLSADATITVVSHGQTEVVTSGPTPTHHHCNCAHHSRDIWSGVSYRLPRNDAHALTLSGPLQTPRTRRTPAQAPSSRRSRRRPKNSRILSRGVIDKRPRRAVAVVDVVVVVAASVKF